MSQSEKSSEHDFPHVYPQKRLKVGIITTLLGYFFLLLGAKPSMFGMDRSPVIGFIQTATFLVGIGIISAGGYLCLMSFWPKDSITLTAGFGVRFVATGFAIAVFCGMADVFGIGTHPITGVPFFGHLQSTGVTIGEGIIALGLVMMILPPHSSLQIKKEDFVAKVDMNK